MSERTEGLIPETSHRWGRRDGDGFTIHLDQRGQEVVSFAESVARGLDDQSRWLDCRYLYDEVGSQIYEKITEQPEYYLTRTEAGILEAHSARVRAIVGDTTVVELGSGSSTKTRHLLDAWVAEGPSRLPAGRHQH